MRNDLKQLQTDISKGDFAGAELHFIKNLRRRLKDEVSER